MDNLTNTLSMENPRGGRLGYASCKYPDHAARIRYQSRELLARKVSQEEKGYRWTMGYNTVVGQWTGGRQYSRFSGSSYNRSLKENSYEKDLLTIWEDLIAVARKVAEKMSGIKGWAVSRAFGDYISRVDLKSAERFVLWLRSQIPGDDEWIPLGIHMLSTRSRGKVKDKATAFYRACPGSRVLATCTFIAPVADRTGVAILNKFLTAIREECKGLQYLWVAERQLETTNNIHFHIILNKRLPIRRFNALWVLQQYNAGLRGHDKYGQEISREEINRRYLDGTVGKVLNPLDVKKVFNIGGLSAYLTEYITKQDKDAIFDCAVWHCSRGVSRLFTRSTVGPSAFAYCCSFHNSRVDKDTGELFPVHPVKGDFYTLVYINNKKVPLNYLREQEQINKWIIQGWRLDRLPVCDDNDYGKYFVCEN